MEVANQEESTRIAAGRANAKRHGFDASSRDESAADPPRPEIPRHPIDCEVLSCPSAWQQIVLKLPLRLLLHDVYISTVLDIQIEIHTRVRPWSIDPRLILPLWSTVCQAGVVLGEERLESAGEGAYRCQEIYHVAAVREAVVDTPILL